MQIEIFSKIKQGNMSAVRFRCPDDKETRISLTPSSGNNYGSVTITAYLSSTGADRTGTITVKNEKGTLEKEVRVTQGTPTSALIPTINDNEFPE